MIAANDGDGGRRLRRLILKQLVNTLVGNARSLIRDGQQFLLLIVRQQIDRVERQSCASSGRRVRNYFDQAFQVATEALAGFGIKNATVVLKTQRQLPVG